MSTATVVPETRELSGEDAWATLRHTDRSQLLVDAFQRMRFSDGFSHARSLAFMISFVAVQGTIAIVGLAAAIGGTGFSDIVALIVRRVFPGPAGEALTAALGNAHANGSQHHWVPLVVGTIGCLVTATTALGQLERGLNRLYGVELDRPAVSKYGRAFVLTLTVGTLSALAFVSLALGRNLLAKTASGTLSDIWNIARWPLGLLAIGVAMTALFQTCPRRSQPGLSWLAFGSAIAVAGWAIITIALGLFFHASASYGQTYGPLAGMVALMLWALLSSMVLFYGAAVAAQLEAVRAGRAEPQDAEKVAESEPEGSGARVAESADARR